LGEEFGWKLLDEWDFYLSKTEESWQTEKWELYEIWK
jgi:hypothetical protein